MRTRTDHFEPSENDDPKAQRLLHAALENIDYTAYAANRKQVAESLGKIDAGQFEKLAAAAAKARCLWIAEALHATSDGGIPDAHQIKKLADLRTTYVELTESYDALRRLVERNYLAP
jgi:hypothetical protein